jgi:hypothetical protein
LQYYGKVILLTEHDNSYWFGDVVDRLVSNALGEPRGPLTDPVKGNNAKIGLIYEAARAKFGRPISLMAAEMLQAKIKSNDIVLMITNSHEMDGAPGIAALARAIDISLGGISIIATSTAATDLLPDPTRTIRVIPETCIAAGLMPVDPSKLKARKHRVSVLSFPPSTAEEATLQAETIVQEWNPSVVVSSEDMGRNFKGVYHTAFGFGLHSDPNMRAGRLDHILDAARAAKIPTISLGDNGNEMGLGTIEEAIRKYQPWGDKCRCPCGSGIATSVKADIAFPVTISNWGCYGIVACLAHLVGDGEVMHNGWVQKRILHACANVGCPDGATSYTTPTEDGTPYMTGVHIVELLRLSVLQSFKTFEREW